MGGISMGMTEDLEKLNETLRATQERVKGNRKEAIRVLHAAGIVTKAGKLTALYRGKQDK